MNKSMSALLVVICLTVKVNAQFFLGLRGSAYGGISNVTYNPAIANSPYLIDINLISAAANINNNYVGVDHRALLHPSYFSRSDFQTLYLSERVNGKNKSGFFGTQWQGPLSFMLSFGPKKNRNLNAIAFSYHANAVLNADNISEVFARTAYYGLGAQADAVTHYLGTALYNGNLSLKGAVWDDFGITYSRVIYNKGDNLVKVGGTFKLLQPIAGANGFVKHLNYQWTEYEQLSIHQSQAQYAYSDGLVSSAGNTSQADVLNYLHQAMAFKAGRPTAGIDLGAVYEWWPDRSKDAVMDCHCEDFSEKKRYKLAVGVSMMDLGALRFKRSPESRDFYADIDQWNVGNAQFPDGLQSLDDTIQAHFALQNSATYFTVWLPTRFNLYIDYNIWKDFGVTLTALVSPNMSPQWRMVHRVSTFSITGKYENKWLGIYLPLSYDVNGNLSLGTTLRIGPLIVGTQDLLGLFAKKYVYNADIHAALKLTIPSHKICRKGDLRFMKKS